MEVHVECADITDEERRKILDRMALIAGMMLKEIKEKGVKSTYEDSSDNQAKNAQEAR